MAAKPAFSPLRIIGTDPRLAVVSRTAITPATALFLQGHHAGFSRIHVQRDEDARVRSARLVDGFGRRHVVTDEDRVRIEQRPGQTGVVPEHDVVQLAASRYTEPRAQAESAGTLHPAGLEFGPSAGLFRLGLLHERMKAQGAVGDLAVGPDVLIGRTQIGPVRVFVDRDAHDPLSVPQRILISHDDGRGLVVRQPVQRVASENVHPGKGIASAQGATAELHDLAARLDLDGPRAFARDQQDRGQRLALEVPLDQTPQVTVEHDIDVVDQDVLGVGQEAQAVAQAAAGIQQPVLLRYPQVPAVLAPQPGRRLVHPVTLVGDIDHHGFQAEGAELAGCQLQ